MSRRTEWPREGADPLGPRLQELPLKPRLKTRIEALTGAGFLGANAGSGTIHFNCGAVGRIRSYPLGGTRITLAHWLGPAAGYRHPELLLAGRMGRAGRRSSETRVDRVLPRYVFAGR